MAAVAGAGGGEEMLLRPRPGPRPRRQRVPLSDLTNLSPATSVVIRLLKPKRTSPDSSASSIGSSTVPRIPTPPPATLSVSVPVAATKGKDKATRELQTTSTHLNKVQKISKPKVKTGGVLPGPSSPPSKNTRKITRKEQPHTEPLISPLISPLYASSKTRVKTAGNVLPDASTLPSKRKMKVTREKQTRMEPLISPLYPSSKTKARTGDGLSGASSPSSKKTRKVTSGGSRGREEEQADIMEEMSCDEEETPAPSEEFIEERRAYFAEVDAFELVEEFVSSAGSDAE